jgi:uncharacterized damage-inducible protein DinB
MYLTIEELLSYTEEERTKWRQWFASRGADPLKIALAGEVCPTVGKLVLHIFGAELWYAYALQGEIVTEESDVGKAFAALSPEDADAIFDFGREARQQLREFTQTANDEEWDHVHEIGARAFRIRGSARKLIAHILVHEIRHWAQVAMAVRQSGLAPPGDHDMLFSESFGPMATRVRVS